MVQELGTLPIQLFGPDELKQRWLPSVRQGRASPGVRPDRAGGRLGPRRDADDRRPGRRERVINGSRTGSRRPGVADFYVVFAVTDRESDGSTALVVEKDRPDLPGPTRAQARHPRVAHRHARLRGRARAGRERHRGGGPGPLRGARNARAHPPGRGGPGSRHRPGRDRLRGLLREGAGGVRQADHRTPGNPVQAGRDGDEAPPPRGSCSTSPRRWPTPGRRPGQATGRWPRCSPPIPRWR